MNEVLYKSQYCGLIQDGFFFICVDLFCSAGERGDREIERKNLCVLVVGRLATK